MGVDLHYGYYHKKCIDKDVLPYLDVEASNDDFEEEKWINGKHVPEGFYDTLREYGTWNEENNCWIFDEVNKLFEMASKVEIPSYVSDYITEHYKDNLVLIIWKR